MYIFTYTCVTIFEYVYIINMYLIYFYNSIMCIYVYMYIFIVDVCF